VVRPAIARWTTASPTAAEQIAYLEQIEGKAIANLDVNHSAVERLARMLAKKMDRREDEILAAIAAC